MLACGGERRDVRHLAAGDERVRHATGKLEQLAQPLARNLLDDRGRGRRREQAGVLVPRRRHPVGSERSRQRAAEHEPEPPSAGHARDAGIRVGHELLEHLARVDRLVLQGTRRAPREACRGRSPGAPAACRATRGSRPRARRSGGADRATRSSPPTLQASASLAECASSTFSSSVPGRWAAASRRSSRARGGACRSTTSSPARPTARSRRCARASRSSRRRAEPRRTTCSRA